LAIDADSCPRRADPIKDAQMKAILSTVALVLGSVMPLGADAGGLRPLEAGIVALGTYTASVYYTVSCDTYEVVTTIAPCPEASGMPIRFVGYLLPGQKAIVSTGEFGTTSAPETLELLHDGRLLLAKRVTKTASLD
jgi:hypothetical protein